MDNIYYCYFSSPVGKLLMLAKNNYLIHLNFDKEKMTCYPNWILNDNLPIFKKTAEALTRYFNGEKETFANIEINYVQGTEFQRNVWNALRKISYGDISSYGELATAINNPKAVRAVGGAVGRNPVSIIIPCHRILGKNRELTGFGGGLAVKRYLLSLEKINYKNKGVEEVKPKFLKKYRTL